MHRQTKTEKCFANRHGRPVAQTQSDEWIGYGKRNARYTYGYPATRAHASNDGSTVPHQPDSGPTARIHTGRAPRDDGGGGGPVLGYPHHRGRTSAVARANRWNRSRSACTRRAAARPPAGWLSLTRRQSATRPAASRSPTRPPATAIRSCAAAQRHYPPDTRSHTHADPQALLRGSEIPRRRARTPHGTALASRSFMPSQPPPGDSERVIIFYSNNNNAISRAHNSTVVVVPRCAVCVCLSVSHRRRRHVSREALGKTATYVDKVRRSVCGNRVFTRAAPIGMLFWGPVCVFQSK